MPSHEIPTPYPHVQRLMGSGKAGVRQLIKTRVTVGTRIALASRCCVITATFDARLGLPSWAHNAVWPRTSRTISRTLHLIDQLRDIDLHCGIPIMGGEMGTRQFTPCSHPRLWNPTRARKRPGLCGASA